MLLDADTSLVVSAEGSTIILYRENSTVVDIGAFLWMDYINPNIEREMCSFKQKFIDIIESLIELRY